jgi:hypothetical protein
MKPIIFCSFFCLISFQIILGQNNDLMDGKVIMPDNSNTIHPDAFTTPTGNFKDSLTTGFPGSDISPEITTPIQFIRQKIRYRTGFSNLNIQNSSEQVTYPAFGGFYHIKSDIIFNPTDKLTFSFGGGLVRYDTPETPNSKLKYGIQSSIQYSFTNWVSLRLYGQRLWSLRPKEKSSFIFMNPMYPQSEAGATISTQIKNIKMDIGPKTIINTESNFKNLNMINTKVSIGF